MKNCKGFTLVELIIALTVGGILLGAVYSTYRVQQQVFMAQDQVAEMQQNIRAVLLYVSREIRMAGYDPKGIPGAGFEESFLPGPPTALRAGRIRFTLDANGDGALLNSTGERVEMGFSPTDDATGDGIPDVDADGDGVPDAISFRRQLDSVDLAPFPLYQSVADNIQALEFLYLDGAGVQTTVLTDIRAIQVSILARARNPDPKFTNGQIYCPASNPFDISTGLCTNPVAPAMTWGPYNDNFRRRLLITTIQCRNMGL